MDTVSRNPNLGLIETVRDELRGAGVEATLTHDPRGKWANLFATIPAHDGETNGGVVLSGHTHVVPVDGQQWDSDPFKPEIRGDKLYGRGTCDMKGFIGAALALVPDMRRAKLARPIHFALSFDEEVGCAGAPLMIADLMKRGVKPDGCIVGEPTSMRPIVAHKGINAYQCCVRGQAAHSSLTPKGLNAIEYAARLICYIRDMADQFREQGPFDELYDVPFTTAQTSTIVGGNAINTVPAECRFQFEFRNLPTLDPEPIFARIEQYARETLLPKMLREHPSAAIEITKIAAAPGHFPDGEVHQQSAQTGRRRAVRTAPAARRHRAAARNPRLAEKLAALSGASRYAGESKKTCCDAVATGLSLDAQALKPEGAAR
ncbi:MAG: Uncharacterized deacetylase [uncultured Paraburkholderia sp.]|nr:MAG: Uncharacterized deacetylase [uncultured Paraburkholderia sp.]CAH2908785.1 MAG: Uncharacterized deacetylase [uncultured Paraburkholderia sp.]